MQPSEQVQYQAAAIHDLMAGTSPAQMDSPTPCAKWNTRDLMNHLVGGGHFFGAAFKGETMAIDPEAPAPDLLGDDPAAAWDGAISAFGAGIDSPGALDQELTLPMGALPGTVVLELLKFDLLVHAWDLAQATGQTFDPPDELVEPALESAAMIVSPDARDGDTFAAEVTPPEGASPIERLAAFTGRAVSA